MERLSSAANKLPRFDSVYVIHLLDFSISKLTHNGKMTLDLKGTAYVIAQTDSRYRNLELFAQAHNNKSENSRII